MWGLPTRQRTSSALPPSLLPHCLAASPLSSSRVLCIEPLSHLLAFAIIHFVPGARHRAPPMPSLNSHTQVSLFATISFELMLMCKLFLEDPDSLIFHFWLEGRQHCIFPQPCFDCRRARRHRPHSGRFHRRNLNKSFPNLH